MSQSVLSFRRQGFRAQLEALDASWTKLDGLFKGLIKFIKLDSFLSESKDDHTTFMEKVSVFMASMITTGLTASVQLPTALPMQPTPTPQGRQEWKYIIMGGIVLGLFIALFQGVLSVPGVLFGLFFIVLALVIPSMTEQVLKQLPSLTEAKPESFEELVAEELGDTYKNKNRIGIMHQYDGAFRLCRRFPDPRYREEWRRTLRKRFLTKIAHLMLMVEGAKNERRAFLNGMMTDVARPTGAAQSRTQGMVPPVPSV